MVSRIIAAPFLFAGLVFTGLKLADIFFLNSRTGDSVLGSSCIVMGIVILTIGRKQKSLVTVKFLFRAVVAIIFAFAGLVLASSSFFNPQAVGRIPGIVCNMIAAIFAVVINAIDLPPKSKLQVDPKH